MLLATILLLCPFPQIGETVKETANPAAMISIDLNDSADATSDSSVAQPLPVAPEAKVKTDADLAAADPIQPGFTPAPAVMPAGTPIRGVKMSITRPRENRRERALWYALSVSGSGAAAFDAWSTRRAISGGYGTEANPLLRPFSHSSAMYAATQVSPLVMDFVGKKMMLSQRKWMRSLWWVPQSAGTGMSVFAGVHNVRLVQ
jgi:hypothetical protein